MCYNQWLKTDDWKSAQWNFFSWTWLLLISDASDDATTPHCVICNCSNQRSFPINSDLGWCFAAITLQVWDSTFAVVKIFQYGTKFALWLLCLLKKKGLCLLGNLFLSPSQQSFFLIFYGRPPQSRQGQMDDCCSLWSCWQRDQQSHNARLRDSESCMPGTLCRPAPTDTLFSGRLLDNTHTHAAGRRHKDIVDGAKTLIKTLKINVHLSPYSSGDVCGAQPLVHKQHKTTERRQDLSTVSLPHRRVGAWEEPSRSSP